MKPRYEALSVFPEVFESYFSTSILGKAQERGLFSFTAHDLRDWTHDRHRSVDDAPFGGGAGMLMKPAPIFEALDDLTQGTERSSSPQTSTGSEQKPYVIFFTPAGTPFTQKVAERLVQHEHVIFVCGRYEGIDQRAYTLADEELSLGDYILTGGELATMVVVDALVRLLPGALGDQASAQDESFSYGLLEYEQYTRPASYCGLDVPDVLLSGDHAKIRTWRCENALKRTALRRPDLLEGLTLSDAQLEFLDKLAQDERFGEDEKTVFVPEKFAANERLSQHDTHEE